MTIHDNTAATGLTTDHVTLVGFSRCEYLVYSETSRSGDGRDYTGISQECSIKDDLRYREIDQTCGSEIVLRQVALIISS